MTSLETLEGFWTTRPGGLAFAAYAEALAMAGRRQEAEQILSDGVVRWPRSLSGRILQGRIASERGDLEAARMAFQSAVEIDGNSRAALRGLADICTRQQYLKLAFETWNRLAILDPLDVEAGESARRLAGRLDSKGDLDSFVQVREHEDLLSREALNEGTSSQAIATSHVSPATLPDFDLNLGEIPAPSSLSATAGFAPAGLSDLPGFQAPELSFSPPAAPAPLAAPAMEPAASLSSAPSFPKFEESAFATLEMPSFPSTKAIPPPPLELPKAASSEATAPLAGSLLTPIGQNPFAISEERLQQAEATQMMPTPTRAGAPVTGNDIEDRLDEVFGDSSSPMPPSAPPLSTSGDFPTQQMPQFEKASVAPAIPEPVVSGKVTGDDVEDRLGELFGETGEMPLAIPAAAAIPTPTPAPKVSPAVVSGDDIEGRLDDLFGESVIDLTGKSEDLDSETGVAFAVRTPEVTPADFHKAGDTSAMPRADETSAIERADDTSVLPRASDTTIESRLPVENKPGAESTTEFHAASLRLDPERLVDLATKGSEIDHTGSTIDLPTLDFAAIAGSETRMSQRLTAEDVDSRLDELFASSEFLGDTHATPIAGKTGFVAKPPAAAPGVVTGNDIEGRLDDLFGGDSDFPVSLPTVTFAEEYLRQGHKDKAVSIYRQLLDRDPTNNDLRRRLDEIEGRS
ncbi:MAG: hypothetical protein RL173_3300 [Fibrobacterota bacterium]|jgi:hypothetical protein